MHPPAVTASPISITGAIALTIRIVLAILFAKSARPFVSGNTRYIGAEPYGLAPERAMAAARTLHEPVISRCGDAD